MTSDRRWLSIHCYTPDPFEPFLREVIAPTVRTLLGDGTADHWFFIRYWDGGPHIRLRLHVAGDVLGHVLEVMRTYTAVDLVETPYEPEYERYGGPAGVAISERQFELSSRVALALIEAEQDWTYETNLGIAVQLNLSFGYALDADLAHTRAFFGTVSRAVLEYLPIAKLPEAEGELRHLFEAFDTSYAAQREAIVAMHQAVWDALGTDGGIDDPLLLSWVRGNAAIAAELRAALRAGQLLDDAGRPFTHERALFGILSSYVHMTNNRLGTRNRDEGFIAYITSRALHEVQPAATGVFV